MMTDSFNADAFHSELTASLSNVLAGAPGTALTQAVERTAAAAALVCQGRPMACAAGCPHCCVLNVAVLVPEAMIIADWMKERLSPEEMAAARERLAYHRVWGRWMDDEERIAKHEVCPMLNGEGSCLIHPVRPIVCRAVTSLDSTTCRDALRPGVNEEAPLVLADLLRRMVFDTAFLSLAEALQAHGYDSRSIDIGVGVLAFLEHPENGEMVLNRGKLPAGLWR
ncbi:MAG TPA: YkgJ family cysteine cluster protein [Geomonas sp.]|nr:YkgJ family cysteine cluster protein [Geomonas sp.]